MIRLRIEALVLKRTVKLVAVFAVLVAVTVAIASFASPPLSNVPLWALLFLIDPMFPVRHWTYDPSDGPILFVHYYWGIETLVAVLMVYFVVCVALAWCWTRIERRAARNARSG